jgi:hypothetical protein
MKTYLEFSNDLVGFWISLGWFSGNDFVLFNLKVFEIFPGNLTIFDLQITKFVIGFGFYNH